MINFSKTYPTDLNYSEWLLIAKFFSELPARPTLQLGQMADRERDPVCDTHRLSVAHAAERAAARQTVYGYFRRWTRSGVWYRLNAALVIQVRTQQGRKSQPSAAIIDSQSVKTSEGGEQRGVDVYKQTAGRKRHIVVDTLGLLLIVVVHSASLQDGSGGKLVLQKLFELIKHSVHNRYCRLSCSGLMRLMKAFASMSASTFGWKLDIVRRLVGRERLQALAAPLDCRTDLRLVGSLSTLGARLRTYGRFQ